MSDPDRIKIKVIPHVIHLESLREKFSTDSYYRVVRSIINCINEHFGWDKDKIQIKDYESNYDKIVEYIIEHYQIGSMEALGAKVASIICPMKMVGYDGQFIERRKELKNMNLNLQQKRSLPTWEEMKESLSRCIKECGHPGGIIIALTYQHGYILTLKDIANTSIIDLPGPGRNFLDMDARIWYIRGDPNKNLRDRQFSVSREYIDDIRRFIRRGSTFLVTRKNGQPYKGNVTLKHLQLDTLDIRGICASYEKHCTNPVPQPQ